MGASRCLKSWGLCLEVQELTLFVAFRFWCLLRFWELVEVYALGEGI